MTALGLEEVANPSLLFTSTALDSADSSSSNSGTDDNDELEPNALPDGTAVLVAMEGTRPILCELQVHIGTCKHTRIVFWKFTYKCYGKLVDRHLRTNIW
jgi:predicted ATP-dependent serine protease